MCNINQYKKLKFTDLLGRYNRIVIPAIQRDYAQGREDKKAAEVRKTLLDDIFSNKDEIDFNLVFGSREEYGGKTCFIPVDGQQRLTTLFLLYLYNSKINGVQTDGLNKFTYETRRAAADFCKAIVDNDWENQKDKLSDSIKDCNWFMQYWNQDPTVISMLRMLDDIQKSAPEGNFKEKLDRITFYFYDLKQNGLNESLYIKMNGRGKPLTAFENLKAAIDNILPEESNYDFKEMGDEAGDSNFKKNWQSCIDKKWTDAFWDKKKPHDIDKNLTKFIVRFLSGCYAALKPNGDQTADDETKKQLGEINANEDNYSSFIPFAPVKKVLELENSFGFLARAFDIISYKKEDLYPTWRNSDFTFTIDELTKYKALSVLMAYVLFDGDKKALRFAWNMAENTVSGYDDFINLCRRFGQIKNHSKIREGIYNVLSEIEFDSPSEQLKEEIEKARQILNPQEDSKLPDKPIDWKEKEWNWDSAIIEAENYAFFKGAIRFLFRNENGEWDWTDFDTKWGNVQRYFDKDGVCDSSEINYKTDATVLKAVLYHVNNFKDKIQPQKFVLDNKSGTWKNNILLSSDSDWANAVHQVLMGNLETKKRDEDCLLYQSLYNSNLLNYVANFMPGSRINKIGQCRHSAIYPRQQTGIIPDNYNFSRNKILSILEKESIIEINPDIVIASEKNDKIYKGWHVQFKYGSYDFLWTADNWISIIGQPGDGFYLDEKEIKENGLQEELFREELDKCIEKRNPDKS